MSSLGSAEAETTGTCPVCDSAVPVTARRRQLKVHLEPGAASICPGSGSRYRPVDPRERRRRQAFGVAQVAGYVVFTVVAGITGILGFIGVGPLFSDEEASDAAGVGDVQVNVEVDDTLQRAWVAPVPQGSMPPLLNCDHAGMERRAREIREAGGVPSGALFVSVSVVNNTGSTLLIKGFELESLDRVDEVKGAPLNLCEGGGGYDIQNLQVDLDDRPPTFTFIDTDGEPMPPIAIAPTPGEPAVFTLIARADDAQYRWSGTLTYILDGVEVEVPISDDGRPFEVAPAQAAL